MSYALRLHENNRIHSAWKVLPNGNYDGMPIVEKLPEDVEKEAALPAAQRTPRGELTNYMWINNAYVYNPKPEEPQPDPGPSSSLEERVATVEADVASLTAAIEKGLAL